MQLSKGGATFRKAAVELVQRFPEVLDALRDGRLCISSVVELAKVLTPENRAEVLPRFFHRSSREAKVVSAELRPASNPPTRDVVTVLRAASGPADGSPQLALGSADPSAPPVVVQSTEPTRQAVAPIEQSAPAAIGPAPRREPVVPLTGATFRLHLTVSREVMHKIEAARDALSHSRPNASLEQILEAGLDLVLAAKAKRNGLAERPLASPRPSKAGAYIPAHVRREVQERDGGRCQFRLDSGELCGSTYLVEVDHLDPAGLGGVATAERCRLACFGHNQLAARRTYGDQLMDRFTHGEPRAKFLREPEAVYAGHRAPARRVAIARGWYVEPMVRRVRAVAPYPSPRSPGTPGSSYDAVVTTNGRGAVRPALTRSAPARPRRWAG